MKHEQTAAAGQENSGHKKKKKTKQKTTPLLHYERASTEVNRTKQEGGAWKTEGLIGKPWQAHTLEKGEK